MIRPDLFCSFHHDEPICSNSTKLKIISEFNENMVLATATCNIAYDYSELKVDLTLDYENSPCRIDFQENTKIFFEYVDPGGDYDQSNFIRFNGKKTSQIIKTN